MFTAVKATIKRIPILGPALVRVVQGSPAGFSGSASYWEQRYKAGGTSGAGSYNRLAEFKADFLNRFVAEHGITSVIEFGSGDGAQLRLASYPDYLGVDVSPTAIAGCQAAFATDQRKRFVQLDALPPDTVAELALSLDVIYHLVEDAVFDAYMHQLFGSATQFVIVYSSNEDKTWSSEHVRHRKFTDWVEQHLKSWHLISTTLNVYPYDPVDPDHTSFANFYVFSRTSGASASA